MAMWTVIIKNSSGSDQAIEDLGITVLDATQITFSDSFTFPEIAESDDLRALVQSGDLVVNDGSSDLSAADGVNFLTLDQKQNTLATFYTKTQLQTSGQASVDWDNIQNAPSFGSPTWLDPVQYRVLDISASPPGGAQTGDVYVDTDDNHYYKYNGVSWDDLGAASTGDRVINLANANEEIYTFGGSTWSAEGVNSDNDAVVVNDDGDGKQAQYIYDTTSASWKKIGDVDFGGHLDGGASKHDASEIDVEGTYTYLSTTDLESVISEIDTEIGNLYSAISAISGNTLDEAYDEGGAGNGRVINADAGSVKIDTGSATNAPFEIVPKASLPSTGLADGQLAVKSGILCIYDATRAKWLSVQRVMVAFGKKGRSKDQYLNHYGGDIQSNLSGLRMLRDATIVGISGQLNASGTVDFNVRKNDVATDILTLSLSAVVGAQNAAANVDLSAGDFLQCYIDNVANVRSPVALVEIAWRP
jgi:hypothetical protein